MFAAASAEDLAQTMRNSLLLTILLLPVGFTLSGSAQQIPKETASFGAEEAFAHPIALPLKALESLRRETSSIDVLQACAEQDGVEHTRIWPGWFEASEAQLSQLPSSGLVVRRQNRCVLGTHIAQFFVLEKRAGGYRVVLRVRARQLNILPHLANGFHDLQSVFVVQGGTPTDYATFRFADGKYHFLNAKRSIALK